MVLILDPGNHKQLIENVDVSYRVHGSGPCIVMIHGLGQDHQIWATIQDALPNYTTLAYDVRGHGHSTLGDADGTLTQLGSDLVNLLEHVGLSICIGFSLGGVIALWAAAERPDLLRGVIAVATSSVVGRAAAESLDERITLFETQDDAHVRELMLTDTLSQLANPDADSARITDERMVAIGDRRGYINGARAVCSMRTESVNDRLASVSAPVLIVSGENDIWCPRRAADIMLEQLPSASFVEMGGVGHLVTDDDPAGLTEIVRQWLEQKELG